LSGSAWSAEPCLDQRNSGQTVKNIQTRVRHPVRRWMDATLDGIIEQTGAVFEAKFMLPWAFYSAMRPG
jgi:hypothetical protein